MKKIIKNAARCKKCGEFIESKHVHDFQTCKCGSCAVDGGLYYLKRSGNLEDFEDASMYEDMIPSVELIYDSEPISEILEINLLSFNKIYDGKIHHFNENTRKAYLILLSLYDEILKNDPNWHFFHEGNYSTLRFTKSLLLLVLEYLGKHKINHSNPELWVDKQDMARKYQKQFTTIFHGISELAMNVETEDVHCLLFDRIYHSAFRMLCYKYCEKEKESDRTEALLLAERAIARASYNSARAVRQEMNVKRNFADVLASFLKENSLSPSKFAREEVNATEPPTDLRGRICWLVGRDRVEDARNLLETASKEECQDEAIQQWARLLAPPVAHVVKKDNK